MGDFEEDKPTILVIVNDWHVREMIRASLDEAGYLAVPVGDAQSTLTILDGASNVKLAVIDIRISGEPSGLDLARMIHERRPDVGLIVTSTNQQLRPNDLPDGARFVCDRPWRGEFLKHVRELLAP